MFTKFLALLIVLLLTASTAYANDWGLRTVMLDAVSATHDWDDYTCPGARAEIQFTDACGLPVAVAVLNSRYHTVLLTTSTAEDDRTQFVRHAVTTAVWQPENDTHLFTALLPLADGSGGFTLCYDETERYCFATQGDNYKLSYAQTGGTAFAWDAVRTGYCVSGENVPDDALWFPPDGQITMTDFNISLFPHSADEAAQLNALTGRIRARLKVQDYVIDRRAKKTLAVYSAPSEGAWRAANGKASVSLKKTVQVFGVTENEEGMWTCVEYGVSNRTSRIGYVKGNLLPGCDAIPLTALSLTASRDTYLTDDPDVSQYRQKEIPAGTELTVLAVYNAYYAYTESRIDGKAFRGFVPLLDLRTVAAAEN